MRKSRVVLIKGKGVLSDNQINIKILSVMLRKGLSLLGQVNNFHEALIQFFTPRDKVGIKINTIAGKKLSTKPQVSLALANLLNQVGIKERNIIIWDRTNKELKGAGYRLNYNGSGIRIFGTDTRGINYEYNLTIHRNIGSRFSKIQSKLINKSISLAILKDHGIAGITGVMKNYFGAIHNPNKYHDTNCDPYIAELSEVGLIKNKNKLSILDGLIVQYHRGPSYHSQWAEKCECFILSTDPVASDFIGWQLIEKIRKKKGLPTLEEEKRKPYYLFTAEKMGLGKANLNEIQLIEYEV
jgi:uncharacterized protein (DUF362 family)